MPVLTRSTTAAYGMPSSSLDSSATQAASNAFGLKRKFEEDQDEANSNELNSDTNHATKKQKTNEYLIKMNKDNCNIQHSVLEWAQNHTPSIQSIVNKQQRQQYTHCGEMNDKINIRHTISFQTLKKSITNDDIEGDITFHQESQDSPHDAGSREAILSDTCLTVHDDGASADKVIAAQNSDSSADAFVEGIQPLPSYVKRQRAVMFDETVTVINLSFSHSPTATSTNATSA